MPEGFDAEEFARTFGRGARVSTGGVEFSDFDLGDIFSSLFGGQAGGRGPANPFGRGGARQQRPARGSDLAGSLVISFAEAALGARKTIRTGSGGTVEISVPAGVESGGRLRVPGQGGAAPSGGGTAGDLYLEIDVRPDPFLQRNEWDIELDLPVTVAEAALGAKVQVPTVEGPVTLTVPPGASSGARLRLRGRGVKKPDGTRGDQFCRIEVAVPKIKPDDAELRRLFEEIGRRTAGEAVRRF